MTPTWRAISVVLAVGFAGYAATLSPPGLWLVAVVYMALPLAAIWFGDPFGTAAELIGFERYDRIVKALGWMALCLTPAVVHLYQWRLRLLD